MILAATFFERALRRVTSGVLARSYLATIPVAVDVDEVEVGNVEAGDVEVGGADHDLVGDADGASGAVDPDETAFTFGADEEPSDATAASTDGGTAAVAAESSDSDGSEKSVSSLGEDTIQTEG